MGDMHDDMHARLLHDTRWRRRFCRLVTRGRHWWSRKPVEWSFGPVDGDPMYEGTMRQCRLCYHTEVDTHG